MHGGDSDRRDSCKPDAFQAHSDTPLPYKGSLVPAHPLDCARSTDTYSAGNETSLQRRRELRHASRRVLLEIAVHLLGSLLCMKMRRKPFSTVGDLAEYVRDVFRLPFVTHKYGIEIERRDIRLLKANRWLNDKIMNMYFEMLQEYSENVNTRVYVLSTYFYTVLEKGYDRVKHWVEHVNLFEYDFVFIPVHLSSHWVFVCLDVLHKRLEYFDSLGGYQSAVACKIVAFFVREHFRYYRRKFCVEVCAMHGITLQKSGGDCGVFVCMYAKRRLDGSGYCFRQDNVLLYRAIMVHEICIGEILYATEPNA